MSNSKNKKKVLNQEFYSKVYSEENFLAGNELYTQYFVKRLNIFGNYKNRRFLDAGCGLGVTGEILKKQYSIEPYGIDINKDAVEQSKKRGVKAVVGSLEKKWPYESNFFDGIISIQVIEHLVNTDLFLTEAYRVLKKNGIIIITTPNLASWFNRVLFIFGFQPFFLEVSTIDKTLGLKFTRKLTNNRTPLGHVRGFTLFALKDLLELHKFEIVKTIGGEVDYLPKVMSKIDKIFANIPILATDLIIVAKKK